MSDTKNNPLVSVVITTKNEENNIDTCLESIRLQTYPSLEIIVVDNNSSDKTKEIAQKYTDKVFNLGPERSAQRNFGMINVAIGDYVMYVDADMILSATLIECAVEHLAKPGVDALHVSEVVLGAKYFSRVRRFERGFYDGTVIDGARIFNRQAFIKAGGFDEDLFKIGSGEDWDIDKKIKINGKIELLPNRSNRHVSRWPLNSFVLNNGVVPHSDYVGIYHNESEFNLCSYLVKKSYYSKGFDGYIQKWGKEDQDVRLQFGIYYRYLGVFIENGKWKRLLLSPMLSFGMYFLRASVGVVYLSSRYHACK